MKTEVSASIIENFKSLQFLLYMGSKDNNIINIDQNTIVIEDCLFKNELVIDNELDETATNAVLNSFVVDITDISIKFTNCTFERDFIIEDINICDLELIKCNFFREFRIKSKATLNAISISSNIFDHRFDISGSFNEIHLHHSEFKFKTFFRNIYVKIEFQITDCIFYKKCTFSEGKFEGYFNIRTSDFETIFNDEFTIRETVEFDSLILFRGINFKYITYISYKVMSSSSSLTIEGINYKFESKGYFNNLVFKNLPPKTIIDGVFINNFILDNTILNEKNSFLIFNSKFKNFQFNNFTNLGSFTINSILDVDKSSSIVISNSNLGKLDFISCDLTYTHIIIDNTKLLDIFYTNTSFPNDIGSNKEKPLDIRQQSDTYGQLKSVSERIGNRFNALKFQSKEIDAFHKSKMYGTEDSVILFLLKWSNNFRQSPLRGLIFTMMIGIIPYILYLRYALDTFTFGNFSFDETFAVFINYVGGYFEFLNPTHKGDFLGKVQFGIAYLWDLLGRVLVGFGIYQTIQAFRKFGKEGS